MAKKKRASKPKLRRKHAPALEPPGTLNQMPRTEAEARATAVRLNEVESPQDMKAGNPVVKAGSRPAPPPVMTMIDRCWLAEWKDRWHAVPKEALPQPRSLVPAHVWSAFPDQMHQLTLGDMLIEHRYGEAEAIILANEHGTTEVLVRSQAISGYQENCDAINRIVADELETKMRGSIPNPFAEALAKRGKELALDRLREGPDALLTSARDSVLGSDPDGCRVEYLYLCSLQESQTIAPLLGYGKGSSTWLEVANARYPDCIRSSQPGFDKMARDYLAARKIAARPTKQAGADQGSKASPKDKKFRALVLRYWLSLGLWLMPYHYALHALRQIADIENASTGGMKKHDATMRQIVREVKLHHCRPSVLKSLKLCNGQPCKAVWQPGE